MRIYLASSWRNPEQPAAVQQLRAAGHEVYDFRNPGTGGPEVSDPEQAGFSWREIDPDWHSWTGEQLRAALGHPVALQGFLADFNAMQWADAFVLLLPCGNSAHLEAGWAIGQGKPTAIWASRLREPELMYLLAGETGNIKTSLEEVLAWLSDWDRERLEAETLWEEVRSMRQEDVQAGLGVVGQQGLRFVRLLTENRRLRDRVAELEGAP